MAISVKTDVGNFELDQGQTGEGALGGSLLGLAAAILAHLNRSQPARPTTEHVNSEKMLPKDIAKYGSKTWPEMGKMVQTLPETMPEIAQTISKILPKYGSKVWPEAGKMVQTLPEAITKIEDREKKLPKDYGGATWPNEGNMTQVLPNNPGREYIPPLPNYGTLEGMTQVETLPLGEKTKIGTLQDSYSKWLRKDMAWPNEGQMVETLPLGDTGKLDVAAPVIPGATTRPNYGTLEGMTQVETLPLGDTGKLDVAAPVIPGATTRPNYGTLEGMTQVETLPLGDTGKLDVAAPVIDVKPNADAEPWVSGATNATATWPNEGQMVESIPPYYNKDSNINWSGPMITDKTGENEETTINPVSFENMYELIKAEQQAQWAREDAIRKETQEREDNAWQRAVEDMFKAGVNPNLVNAGPAESGGGITNATGMNYTMWESELQKEVALLQQSIDQNFKGDENDKDRFTQILGNILSMFSVIAMFKGKI